MKMSSRTLVSSVIVLLAFLTISIGMSLGKERGDSLCQCTTTVSRFIIRELKSIELFHPSPHCVDTEIIATLKETGQKLCLDPNATWVKMVIERVLVN